MTMPYKPKRCECCDLPVESCGLAAERRQIAEVNLERARLLSLPGAIAARFPSKCGSCGQRYDAGTPIIAHRNRGWRSLECCEVA